MSDDFEILANKYGVYAVPPSFMDRVVPQVLAKGRVYEARTVEFIRENAGTGDVIAGGAFVGDFLPGIARALAPGAQLHTFEPNPLTARACRRTIALNRLDNVALHEKAAADRPGTLTLRIFDRKKKEPAAAQAQIVRDWKGAAEHVVEVAADTIDAMVPEDRRVSVLQLDLEGFEGPALKGAVGTIRRSAPIVILEGRQIDAAAINELIGMPLYLDAGRFERNAFFVPDPDLAGAG